MMFTDATNVKVQWEECLRVREFLKDGRPEYWEENIALVVLQNEKQKKLNGKLRSG